MKPAYYVRPGERVRIVAPHSEVCMHMRIAGKPMLAELRPSHAWGYMVQLYRLDGTPYSAAILTGEAGFYQDSNGYYCYPDVACLAA